MPIYRAVLAVDRYELLAEARSIIARHRNLLLAGEAAVSIELINLLNAVPADVAIVSMAAPNSLKIEVIQTIAQQFRGLKFFFVRNRGISSSQCPTRRPPWLHADNPLTFDTEQAAGEWRYT